MVDDGTEVPDPWEDRRQLCSVLLKTNRSTLDTLDVMHLYSILTELFLSLDLSNQDNMTRISNIMFSDSDITHQQNIYKRFFASMSLKCNQLSEDYLPLKDVPTVLNNIDILKGLFVNIANYKKVLFNAMNFRRPNQHHKIGIDVSEITKGIDNDETSDKQKLMLLKLIECHEGNFRKKRILIQYSFLFILPIEISRCILSQKKIF